jgi:hypothetical protein
MREEGGAFAADVPVAVSGAVDAEMVDAAAVAVVVVVVVVIVEMLEVPRFLSRLISLSLGLCIECRVNRFDISSNDFAAGADMDTLKVDAIDEASV